MRRAARRPAAAGFPPPPRALATASAVIAGLAAGILPSGRWRFAWCSLRLQVAAGCAWLGELLSQYRSHLRNSHGRRGHIPVGGRFFMGSGASFAALANQAMRFVSRN